MDQVPGAAGTSRRHQPRIVLVLSESETLVDPQDLTGLVRLAVVADQEGIDAVMLSEHVVLGPSAGAAGRMANPREYAAPGNQDPAMAWPNSLLTLAAIASVTERVRLVASAVIAPLRHPLLLAKEIGTLDLLSGGRLVVQPTVSWHTDEYAALGVPFHRRGAILDEQLEILAACWQPGPVRHQGEFFSFDDVWVEPRPVAQPAMWFGGQGMPAAVVRRLVRYGSGLNPFGPVTDDDLAVLRAALVEADRDPNEVELVGGIRATFRDDGPADLDEALADVPRQLEQGFTTLCVKPAMFIDDVTELPTFCAAVLAGVAAAAA